MIEVVQEVDVEDESQALLHYMRHIDYRPYDISQDGEEVSIVHEILDVKIIEKDR